MSLLNSSLKRTEFIWWGTVTGFVFLLIYDPTGVSVAGDEKNAPGISVHQVKQMLYNPDVVILDVRKHRNWWQSSKKILTAVRENPSEVDQWSQHYPKNKTLIFY